MSAAAKMQMLKELIGQMQDLMAEGEGDDAEAGADAMESLGDEPEVAAEAEKEEGEEGEPDIKAAVREAFHGKPKAAPSKGAMVVMSERSAPAAPKKEFPPKKKKGMNYG